MLNPSTLYVVIQRKGRIACPVCGPKIKYCHSKRLGNEVFYEYMHFLSKNHRHRTTDKHLFNGKQETTLKPQRMTPHLCKLKYNK